MKGEKGDPQGVLAIWNDLDPKIETDYHEWYWQEHLLERLAIPGFLTARRYEGVGNGPKYFSFYLTTSVEVLRTPEYLQRIHNPTEWTRRCMASFRNMNRTACRQTIDLGRGIGSDHGNRGCGWARRFPAPEDIRFVVPRVAQVPRRHRVPPLSTMGGGPGDNGSENGGASLTGRGRQEGQLGRHYRSLLPRTG